MESLCDPAIKKKKIDYGRPFGKEDYVEILNGGKIALNIDTEDIPNVETEERNQAKQKKTSNDSLPRLKSHRMKTYPLGRCLWGSENVQAGW